MTISSRVLRNMPYTVPKLSNFSPAALDSAVRDLLSALKKESEIVLASNVEEVDHDVEWKKRWDEWKAFRDRWMARKNGILSQVNDLWLKSSPKDAKREVGRRVNELKTGVEEEVSRSEALLQKQQWDAEKSILESPGTK